MTMKTNIKCVFEISSFCVGVVCIVESTIGSDDLLHDRRDTIF